MIARYLCDECGKSTQYKERLPDHIRAVHEGNRPFICDICDQGWKEKGALITHIRGIHDHQRCFKCLVCGLAYTQSSHLKLHIANTHDRIRHQCDVCGKLFGCKSNLAKHTAIHLGLRPFECGICNATFTISANLDTHRERIHEKIKQQFRCDECGGVFGRKDHLTYHIVAVHLKLAEFSCGQFAAAFHRKSHRAKHKQLIHQPRTLTCDYCSQVVSARSALVTHIQMRHLRLHRYKCQLCDARFFRNSDLNHHNASIHQGVKYECDNCGQVVRCKNFLNRHIKFACRCLR